MVSKKSGISGTLRVIQAGDTPTRTGNGSRRRAEKPSDDKNCANKNRFISDGPESFPEKKLSVVAYDLRKGVCQLIFYEVFGLFKKIEGWFKRGFPAFPREFPQIAHFPR